MPSFLGAKNLCPSSRVSTRAAPPPRCQREKTPSNRKLHQELRAKLRGQVATKIRQVSDVPHQFATGFHGTGKLRFWLTRRGAKKRAQAHAVSQWHSLQRVGRGGCPAHQLSRWLPWSYGVQAIAHQIPRLVALEQAQQEWQQPLPDMIGKLVALSLECEFIQQISCQSRRKETSDGTVWQSAGR